MFLVLKNLKLNPALTLGLGFLEAFLLRLRRAFEGLSTAMVLHTQVYNGVQWFHIHACTMGSLRSSAKSTICNCWPTHFLFFNSRMVMRVQISRCLYFLSLCAIHNTPSTLLKNGMCKFHNARPASCPSHYSAHSGAWVPLSFGSNSTSWHFHVKVQ